MSIDEYIETEDALFHYTKMSVAIEKILFTQNLKLSLLKNTNDPREYKFMLFGTIWWGKDDISKLSDEAHPIINRILKNECKLLCFCSNEKPTMILNDGSLIKDEHTCSKGWSKSRMWSQYGEDHYGACLVFSKEQLEKELETKEPQIKDYKTGCVQYSQKYGIDFDAYTFDGNRLIKEGIEDHSYNHVMENYEAFFFRKHLDYRDEAEYRIVVFDSANKLEYLDISSSIRGIIVGDRTSEAYFPLINQFCKTLDIESRKLYWDRGEPVLLVT